jgi:hypothetical protein
MRGWQPPVVAKSEMLLTSHPVVLDSLLEY